MKKRTKKAHEYKSRKSFYFSSKQAQSFGERIKKISVNGRITPEMILDDGKKTGSPFFLYFEWDNKKCGHEYRMIQAKRVLTCMVEIVTINDIKREVRSFYSVRETKNKKTRNVYVTLHKALNKKDYRLQKLDEMINQLKGVTDMMVLFRDYN